MLIKCFYRSYSILKTEKKKQMNNKTNIKLKKLILIILIENMTMITER